MIALNLKISNENIWYHITPLLWVPSEKLKIIPPETMKIVLVMFLQGK